MTHPAPGASCIPPQVKTPAPSAPGRTAQHRPRTGAHARTLDALHRSALDTRQAARDRSGRRRALVCCTRNVFMCLYV
nr:MAG TPA: hypothetical protein [Caudoviricetes sp.]